MSSDYKWHGLPADRDPRAVAEVLAKLRERHGDDIPLVLQTRRGRLHVRRVREGDGRVALLELDDGHLRLVALNRIERIGHLPTDPPG